MSAGTLVEAEPGLLPGDEQADLAAHERTYGALPRVSRAHLVDLLRDAGLTGHGGAGFPTWRKLDALGSGPVVVANGAEGEPASAKDAALLRQNPHLVLDGLEIVATAVGARRLVLASTAPRLAPIRAAVAQRGVVPEIVAVPERFISGQESALAAVIDGRPARPDGGPLRVSEQGIDGRPTLVLNVETLALVALIVRRGPGWYASHGTADDPGLFLATVSGAVRASRVVEVSYGARLVDVLDAADGATRPIGAVLIGGYHGSWISAADAERLRLAPRSMAEFGTALGAGVVIVHPSDACGLVATARIAGWLAEQSAGQCGPCLNGLPRMAGELLALAERRGGAAATAAVRRYADLADGRGACRHPDGTVRMVTSALRVFADEVQAHENGRCVEETG